MAGGTGESGAKRPGTRAGRWSLLLGLAAPLAALAGALAASRQVVDALVGFNFFALSVPMALAGLVLGWVGLLRSRKGRNPTARRQSLAGSIFSVLTLSAVGGLALPSAPYPLINDITTDLADPPKFVKCTELTQNRG